MRGRTWSRRWANAWLLLAALGMGVGCGGKPWFAESFKQQNSYDLKGEQVEVRMLTKTDLQQFRIEGAEGAVKDEELAKLCAAANQDLHEQFPAAEPQFAPLAGLIPIIAGLAVDAVKADLDKEAQLFEAQFNKTYYGSGFWKGNIKGQTIGKETFEAQYRGFAITRRTKYATERYGLPAYTMVFELASEGGDPRLFKLRPVLFQTTSAKAKVSSFATKLDSKINLGLDATWVDQDQGVHQERVATADFEIRSYDLAEVGIFTPGHRYYLKTGRWGKREMAVDDKSPLTGQLAGWFVGVPVSTDADGKVTSTGNFKLSALVTERDQSQARNLIEHLSKFVEDNKSKIVTSVTPKPH